jgi:RNA polymerase sigma-70 factor (ECF subfamily)
MNVEEKALVEGIQAGDVELFSRLMELHARRLRAFIALRAPVPQLIDEVAHETFVFAFQNIHKFEAGTALDAWLRTIAVNILRSAVAQYARETARTADYNDEAMVSASLEAFDPGEPDELEHLEICLEKVPGESRELLHLKYAMSHSTKEMAGMLKKSMSWVRTTLFRIRQQLEACMRSRMAMGASS